MTYTYPLLSRLTGFGTKVNEWAHEVVFRNMSEETKKSLSDVSKFGISLGSGIIAGFAAAILSHPADTLLSQINKGHGPTGSMVYRLTTLAREAGFKVISKL